MAERDPAAVSLRVDKLLWFLRLSPSRERAKALAETGTIRIDGRRVDRGSQPVRAGSVLTLPLAGGVAAIRILRIPSRRGPAPEARGCYCDAALPAVVTAPLDAITARP